MSRLYDELLAARGTWMDEAMHGALTTFGGYLEQAQCFLLSDEISVVCSEICRTKPSSILSALDLTRAPYPYTWIEWGPASRLYSQPNDKPIPRKLGCLLMTGNKGAKGYFALTWVHGKHDITLNPFGLIFDWDRTSTEPVIGQYGRYVGIANVDRVVADKRAAVMDRLPLIDGRWARFHNDPVERQAVMELELRADLIPLEFCLEFISRANMIPGTPQFESYANDLNGELPFIESFLLLLNSRNSIVAQTRDDFTKLNKARVRHRKPPLKEFINTRISLNRVQTRRAYAHGTTHEQMRLHLCRGHFKIRRSGVYWWSAHMRGHGPAGPARREYDIH